MICALDTQTLIWAIRGKADERDQEKIKRAQLLIKILDRDDSELILPAVSVAELLVPLSPREQTAFLNEISRRFRVVPFDLSCAAVAAELYRKHQTLKPEERIERRVVRADTLIIASAKIAGATVFYSNDRKCRNLASFVMNALDLPSHDEELFPTED